MIGKLTEVLNFLIDLFMAPGYAILNVAGFSFSWPIVAIIALLAWSLIFMLIDNMAASIRNMTTRNDRKK